MILLIIVGVAVFVLLVGAVVFSPSSRESSEERIRRQVIDADQEIQREYRDARRAMNIAAGQAWRNLTD